MKKLLKMMTALILAVSIFPAKSGDFDVQDNKKQPSHIEKLISFGSTLCSGVASAFMGKWAVTTMIDDYTLYAARAKEADSLLQSWLDLISKGTFKLLNSEYSLCGMHRVHVDFGPSLTLSTDPAVIEQALNQASRIPLISLIPQNHPFFEAAQTAAGNWNITIPVLYVSVLIGAASVGYICNQLFKNNNKENLRD